MGEGENRLAEVSDWEITRNHAMIIDALAFILL